MADDQGADSGVGGRGVDLGRAKLQDLAHAKLQDAELLFAHDRFSNAYYLYGYAVEIALKARIARRFLAETIPDKNFVVRLYTHNLKELVKIAGLSLDLAREQANADSGAFWAVVEQWSPDSRYEIILGEQAAAMRSAVTHPNEGVFQWIISRW